MPRKNPRPAAKKAKARAAKKMAKEKKPAPKVGFIAHSSIAHSRPGTVAMLAALIARGLKGDDPT
jgi:hypothetical protein